MIIKNSLFIEDYKIFDFISSIESESKYTLFDLGERKDVVMKKREDNNYSCIIKHISPQSKILQFTYEDIIIENSKATLKINRMNHTNTSLQITNCEGICSADCTINGFSSKERQKLPQQSIIAEYYEYDPTLFSAEKSCIEYSQTINQQSVFRNCVELKIDGFTILMYYITTDDKRRFLAFRTNDNMPQDRFSQITYSARLILGLTSGYFINGYSWQVCFDMDNQMIQNFFYKNNNGTIFNHHPLLDYSSYDKENETDCFKLNPTVFNNLVKFLMEDENIQRATFMLINAPNNIGISKGCLAAVALETISNTKYWEINQSDQSDSRKENGKIKELQAELKNILKKYKEKIEKESYTKILSTIGKIKEKSNAQKLYEPFLNLKISLSEKESFTIRYRNTILHGGIPKREGCFEKISSDIFVDYISFELIMLTAIILLRKAGYSGKVIDWGNTMRIKKYAHLMNKNIKNYGYFHRVI